MSPATDSKTAAAVEKAVKAIMDRRNAASGIAIFLDPVILEAILWELLQDVTSY